MKKFKNNFAYGAAALLFGAMTFTSCSSDDEVVNVNPTFNGESVKTQFAINIPHSATQKTRMTAGNTQADGDKFLGMKNIRLYPFTLTDGTESPSTTENIVSAITLPNLTTTNIYGESDANRSSKIYDDVTIPVETNHFLFYGEANVANAKDFDNGSLTATFGNSTVGDISFALNDILTGDNTTPSNNEQAKALLAVLNGVENVQGWSSSTDNTELKKLYDDFVKMKAGSASSIKAALESLYNAASKLKSSDNDVADKIMKAIVAEYSVNSQSVKVFTATASGTESPITYTLTYSKNSKSDWFPRNLSLPDGAVAVNFNSNGTAGAKFSYVSSNQIIGTPNEGETKNNINVANLTYPASLYYYANTGLKASDNSVAANSWPTSTSDWTSGFTDWGDKVLATTRSIAMKDNVNYGVGNLALAIKAGSNVLKDRKSTAITDEESTSSETEGTQREITVGNNTFPITAILIGGQPASVGFDFKPASTASFTKTIYDKVETDNGTPKYYATYKTFSTNNITQDICNYTLALPNVKSNPDDVQFAIELQNNSETDFVGHEHQIIYKGSKFYLLGKLKPAEKNSASKPENSQVANVFESDYMTTAKVTITSLENAYNVIPDLRATNLEFGLSVDLKWEEGITFDVEIK